MNALIVAAAPVAGSPELVARLAPTVDLVIAVDHGGAVCLDAGVNPDVLLGDFDSIDPAAFDWLRDAGSRVVRYPVDKDRTDLELALEFAREEGVSAVMVTAASSGRLDHTLCTLGALAAAGDLSPMLVEPDVQAWVLTSGHRQSLTVSGLGATLSVLAICGEAIVSITGARWPLDHALLEPCSGLGLSNAVTSDSGSRISVHEGVAVVLAPRMPEAVRATAE